MNKPSRLVLKVEGMDCAEEAAVIRDALKPFTGVGEAPVIDLLNGRVALTPNPGISETEILAAIKNAGMNAEPWRPGPALEMSRSFWARRGRSALVVASGGLTGAGLLLHASLAGGFRAALGSEGMGFAHHPPFAVIAIYVAAVLTGGWHVFPKAWAALKRFRPDMNLLMSIALLGAMGIGEWFEASTVAFLFGLSLVIESWSVGRARRAVESLMNLAPPTALLVGEDGSTSEVPTASVAIGARFRIRPGERVPLDGRVVSGQSDVNQAPITGESVPVEKRPGDELFAGTINGDGALEVESTKAAGDTTLAHIIAMVGEAQARRAPSEQWVERFARIYTPVVFALAFGVLLIPPLLLGGSWPDWVYRSLVLLVIGCPCALVISTPVSIVASIAAAARNGVLIKGGAHVETPARLKVIAFDKTGTLTRGAPALVEIVPLSGHGEDELLAIGAAMEAHSDHPLARAICAEALRRGLTPPPADHYQLIQGKGATARLNGEEYWLGSHRYLEERDEETGEVHEMLAKLSAAGRSVVIFGKARHVCGFLVLSDEVRPEAKRALLALHEAGIRKTVMLTGDNQATAHEVGMQAGVDEVKSELLPADKVAAIESMVSQYGAVAMVGDGINDAPAMARATLGIAMGAAGSDAAIEAADIALMSDDLSKLPWLIGHSRRTLAIIRQNIAFSLLVKLIFVILTFTGHASLWAAITADMGASLLVIFNGMRLLDSGSTQRQLRTPAVAHS